jgi:hypothetical protein
MSKQSKFKLIFGIAAEFYQLSVRIVAYLACKIQKFTGAKSTGKRLFLRAGMIIGLFGDTTWHRVDFICVRPKIDPSEARPSPRNEQHLSNSVGLFSV